MKTDLNRSGIEKDLLKLYCKVRHPLLEDMYIRVAQSQNNNISSWLVKNNSIKEKLKNPSVYDAIETLAFIRGKAGDNPSVSDIINLSSSSQKYLSTIPIIILFNGMLGRGLDILDRFKGIIGSLASWRVPEGQYVENPDEVFQDISLINQNYISSKLEGIPYGKTRPHRTSKEQQRKDIFAYLFTRFSDEIASACESAGLPEIAQKIREGILAVSPPMGLGKFVELDPISNEQVRASKIMADYVFNYPDMKNASYLHDLVEINLLQNAGVISPEDAYKFKELYENERDVLDYLNDEIVVDMENQKGIDSGGSITSDSRLNPDYIYMVVVFFMILQMKLKIPSSGMVMT